MEIPSVHGTIDPSDCFALVPRCDWHKTENKQRKFLFRFMNGREWKQAAAAWDAVSSATTGNDAFDRALDGLAVSLTDWENVGEEFKRENFDLAMGQKTAIEFLGTILAVNEMTPDQLKKFVSRSESEEASFAPAAEEESDVPNSLTVSNPSTLNVRAVPVRDASNAVMEEWT